MSSHDSNQLDQHLYDQQKLLHQGQNGNDVDSEANKRIALAGQWRTPPLPVFPTSGLASDAPHASAATIPANPTVVLPPDPLHGKGLPIPDNSEDYAKALQEAYRRGAEAAAALVQQQQQTLPPSVSCPNFVDLAMKSVTATSAIPRNDVIMPSSAITTVPSPGVPIVLSTAPLAPPVVQAANQQQSQVPNPLSKTNATSSTLMPPLHPPSMSVATTPAPGPSRSLSLPDMASYAAREKADEEKRQKRLARNRASARLRRLRKKNLVDAYETEVGILEKSLANLRAHSWGNSDVDDHKALLEALSMERGQQAIPPEERASLINDILQQQLDQVNFLQESQMEQQVLSWLAHHLLQLQDDDDEEAVALARELQELLQLSPEQCQRLHANASVGLDEEVQALNTVKSSLQVMKENDWLINDGVSHITDQFVSILHPNQVSKFLLWTDANAEAIDQLDYVHVVTPTPNAPIFSFGVDDYHASTSGGAVTSASPGGTGTIAED